MRSIATVAAALAIALALAACGAGTGTGGGSPPDLGSVGFDTAAWSTDFSRHSVPLEEFASGGPGKDGIPAIDRPRFVTVGEGQGFLEDREPVAVVELGGVARAYPIRIMVWHEIVNDTLAGQPIAVTYCPLCNSTVAFERRVGDRVLDFGTTGNLRNSDLVMYDRQTESWWQQLTGEGVVGELSGERLQAIPSQILSWAEFKRLYPDGDVLSTETGYERFYGTNPYVGYEPPDSVSIAPKGREGDSLPAKERVAAVRTGPESAVVYPFSRLRREAPLADRIEGEPVVVRDSQTGSTWGMDGRASAGPLRGEELRPLVSDDQFWFALAAFFPEATIRR